MLVEPRNNQTTDYRIPIVIGVTGHRDLQEQDRDELLKLVHNIIDEKIRQPCRNSPLFILSPLAEGADRLVAWAALEHRAELIAILPMPVEEYEKDFKSPE